MSSANRAKAARSCSGCPASCIIRSVPSGFAPIRIAAFLREQSGGRLRDCASLRNDVDLLAAAYRSESTASPPPTTDRRFLPAGARFHGKVRHDFGHLHNRVFPFVGDGTVSGFAVGRNGETDTAFMSNDLKFGQFADDGCGNRHVQFQEFQDSPIGMLLVDRGAQRFWGGGDCLEIQPFRCSRRTPTFSPFRHREPSIPLRTCS